MLKLTMTLYERNTFFKTAMILCGIVTLLLTAFSFIAFTEYNTIYNIKESSARPENLFQMFTSYFLKTDYLAVHISLALSVLFSLFAMIFTYFYFERTSAPEIIYISFFTFSLTFEVLRLIYLLHVFEPLPIFLLTSAARFLIFARYFGFFSLFTASVCAAGLEIQRTRNVILVLVVPALVISLGVPINTQSWDTGFNPVIGYKSILLMIEIMLFCITVISFFVAVGVRSSKQYIDIGIGAAMCFLGRNILLNTDNWAGPVAGIFLLSIGTWLMCSRLHKIHLWL